MLQGKVTPESDMYGLGVLLAALSSQPGQAHWDAKAKQAYRFQPSAELNLDAGILPPAGKVCARWLACLQHSARAAFGSLVCRHMQHSLGAQLSSPAAAAVTMLPSRPLVVEDMVHATSAC